MYIFEAIKKFWYKTYVEPKIKEDEKCIRQYDATDETPNYQEDYEDCEHVFMPIDSTNEVLACTKCGILANKKDVYKNNIFERKEI